MTTSALAVRARTNTEAKRPLAGLPVGRRSVELEAAELGARELEENRVVRRLRPVILLPVDTLRVATWAASSAFETSSSSESGVSAPAPATMN
jgi:hypothetical protein